MSAVAEEFVELELEDEDEVPLVVSPPPPPHALNVNSESSGKINLREIFILLVAITSFACFAKISIFIPPPPRYSVKFFYLLKETNKRTFHFVMKF